MTYLNRFPSFLLILAIAIIFSCNDERKTSPSGQVIRGNTETPPQHASNGLDKSPMDMIYFPPDYPQLEGRSLFGDILQIEKPWRMGANEATEIEFFRDVSIADTQVKKGRYVIYAVPHENAWEIRLNGNLYTWGLNIDCNYDITSFTLPSYSGDRKIEAFTMEFIPNNNGTELVLGWDTLRVSIPIFWQP
jgi:hypothetical protein